MNMKKLFLPVLAALLSGCATQNPVVTSAIVRATVSTGALFGIEQDPTVVPYLQAATPIICDAAGTSQLDPATVVAALGTVDPKLKTAAGVAIINSSLAIYEALYSAYGTNVQNSVVQPYLEGVCLGLKDALPPVSPLKTARVQRTLPPHVR